MNTRNIIIVVLLLLLLLLGWVFLGNKTEDEKEIKKDTNEKEEVVVENKINYVFKKDSYMSMLLVLSEIDLVKPLAENETIKLKIETYDVNDSLIETYYGNGSYYDFDDNQDIEMGFVVMLMGNQLDTIEDIKVEIEIVERNNMEQRTYQVVSFDEYDYRYELSMYRLGLELDEDYFSHSGLAVLNYGSNVTDMFYLSYLDSINFIGVTGQEDFIAKNGNELETVDVYQIITLYKTD